MMVKLEKDLKSKNISQLEQENFYEKLMVLKHEQADHIRLVERVYRSEVYMEQEDNSQPRSILKTSNLEVTSWYWEHLHFLAKTPHLSSNFSSEVVLEKPLDII